MNNQGFWLRQRSLFTLVLSGKVKVERPELSPTELRLKKVLNQGARKQASELSILDKGTFCQSETKSGSFSRVSIAWSQHSLPDGSSVRSELRSLVLWPWDLLETLKGAIQDRGMGNVITRASESYPVGRCRYRQGFLVQLDHR